MRGLDTFAAFFVGDDVIRDDIDSFCRNVVADISPQLLSQLEIAESPDTMIGRVRRYFGVQA